MSNNAAKNILSDILAKSGRAVSLFERDYTLASERKIAVDQAAKRRISPVVLAEIQDQNKNIGPEVDAQLAKLSLAKVAAVVTGQQLGFGGGPLLTLYKILTAVKLASILEQETGVPTVPIYWLQTEDHDYAEIKDAWIFDKQANLTALSLEFPEAALGGPVGELVIEKAVVGEIIAKFYLPGETLATAYRRLMQNLLGRFGVVVFDANRPTIKRQFQEFIATTINRSTSIGRVLKDRSLELEQLGYQEQVRVRDNSPLFFYQHKQKRERLSELPNGNWLGSDFELSKAELFGKLEADPSRFTTSALIRPIYQDLVLPTAAYVAGPSEYNYWAQITPLYSFFGLAQPLVVPRARLVVVDYRLRRLLDKTSLKLEDLKHSASDLIKQRFASADLSKRFSKVEQDFKDALESLGPELLLIDKNLEKPLRQTIESSLANIGKLKGKFEQALVNRESVLASQIEKARSLIYPNGQDQDRLLSMLSYYFEYGPQFFDAVFEKVSPFQGIEPEIVDKLGPEANDPDHA